MDEPTISISLSTFHNLQSWASNCEQYEKQLRKEGNIEGANFHRGAKQAFERVIDTMLEGINVHQSS